MATVRLLATTQRVMNAQAKTANYYEAEAFKTCNAPGKSRQSCDSDTHSAMRSMSSLLGSQKMAFALGVQCNCEHVDLAARLLNEPPRGISCKCRMKQNAGIRL